MRKAFLLVILLLLALSCAEWIGGWTIRASAAPLAQATPPLPRNNWTVCENLGIGRVPGLSGTRQRFALCQPKGYEVKAYCLQPGWPAPALGTHCTQQDGLFYCGAGFQNMRLYAILRSPAQETPTPTLTPTTTVTPTPTSTATATPTLTATPTSTATATATPTLPAGVTPTVTSTRPPRPGGNGVSDTARAAAPKIGLLLLVGLAAFWSLRQVWKSS